MPDDGMAKRASVAATKVLGDNYRGWGFDEELAAAMADFAAAEIVRFIEAQPDDPGNVNDAQWVGGWRGRKMFMLAAARAGAKGQQG